MSGSLPPRPGCRTDVVERVAGRLRRSRGHQVGHLTVVAGHRAGVAAGLTGLAVVGCGERDLGEERSGGRRLAADHLRGDAPVGGRLVAPERRQATAPILGQLRAPVAVDPVAVRGSTPVVPARREVAERVALRLTVRRLRAPPVEVLAEERRLVAGPVEPGRERRAVVEAVETVGR